ncbi:MAG: hypothetical protein LAT75_04230 [Candidatus Cyclonatronum sp.]|uniref:hypothetical protein n=1 Tax=Cyclonatronum sp. TaxID=3024185 RepID=UPI0025C2C9DE|nr:hypothetical protein [Cyclonatronum sp.]MCH8486047.1 hypothetical protein [Cyclonatronum sp.]
MNKDIFKLIFEHDLRLEQLSGNADPRGELKRPSTLEEFMKPVPVYSKFYFTGTRFGATGDPQFGFSALDRFDSLFAGFMQALKPVRIFSGVEQLRTPAEIQQWAPTAAGQAFVLCGSDEVAGRAKTAAGNAEGDGLFAADLSVREKIDCLKPVLDAGAQVVFTEQAHNGFDLHLFSKANIYESFFDVYQPMTGTDTFRFFSINGKRAKSERLFYFETWTLERPPHGFEEVFPETRLR